MNTKIAFPMIRPTIFNRAYFEQATSRKFSSVLTAYLHHLTDKTARQISPSPYFDAGFYSRAYGSMIPDKRYFVHYITVGWRRGCWPNPVFDPAWYCRTYKDIPAGTEPLRHYLRKGRLDGRSTCALFSPAFYRSLHHDVAASGIEPMFHYLHHGRTEGRRFNAVFDPKWYASEYADVIDAEMAALHYLTEGYKRRLSPSPYFDTAYYLETHQDVADAGVEPLWHYDHFGRFEGRNPNPYFDSEWYLSENPDVDSAGFNPLHHFALYGDREGRRPNPQYNYQQSTSSPAGVPRFAEFIKEPEDVKQRCGLGFDETFYVAANPHIPRGMTPVSHYQKFGKALGFAPNRYTLDARDQILARWKSANHLSPRRVHNLVKSLGDTKVEQLAGASLVFPPGVELVSFDVFDTLLERSSGAPATVFALVAEKARALLGPTVARNFVKSRLTAEDTARRRFPNREIRLSDIYIELGYELGLSTSTLMDLMRIEEEVEFDVSDCKEVGKQIYTMARRSGLPIVLLSDMYLPRDLIQKMLKKQGYDDYEELFVSSETGVTKHSGHAFRLLLKRLQCDPHRVIHIGDNEHSDIAVPRSLGLKVMGVKHSADLLPTSSLWRWYSSDLSGSGLWKATAAGVMTSYVANFVRDRNDIKSLARQVGFLGLGPTLYSFAHFLSEVALSHRYKRLYFVARDGFYLKRAYDILRAKDDRLPPSTYLLSSRIVSRLAAIRTVADALAVVNIDHHPVSIRQLLSTRFALDERQLQEVCLRAGIMREDLDRVISCSKNDGAIQELVKAGFAEIETNASSTRKTYTEYLRSIGMSGTDLALVDIGYRGTIQKTVADLLGTFPAAIYFATWAEARQLTGLGLKFDTFHEVTTPNDPLIRYVQLFELLFSGTHGTLLGFTKTNSGIAPRLAPSDVSRLTALTLGTLRGEALSAVSYLNATFSKFDRHPVAPPAIECIQPLTDYLKNPPAPLVAGLSSHVFEDLFGGATTHLVTPRPKHGAFSEALKASLWPEGAARLWSSTFTEADLKYPGVPLLDRFEDQEIIPAKVDW